MAREAGEEKRLGGVRRVLKGYSDSTEQAWEQAVVYGERLYVEMEA